MTCVRKFKFEEMWLDNDKCEKEIVKVWKDPNQISRTNILEKKLTTCMESKEFGNNRIQINSILIDQTEMEGKRELTEEWKREEK